MGDSANRKKRRGLSSEISLPVEEAFSSSPEAIQAYRRSKRAGEANGDLAARPSLERAISLDPNFALAYGNLAAVEQNPGENSQAVQAAIKAFNLRNRELPRNRFFTEAMYYSFVTGEIEKVAQVFSQEGQLYPHIANPHVNLGSNLIARGRYDAAIPELQEGLRLYPDGVFGYWNLVTHHHLRPAKLEMGKGTNN